jgi:fructose-1,6-bisphosphatase/inositol monophosphatase family enzyme
MTNEWYIAMKGLGSYLNGQRIHVSSVEHIKDAMIVNNLLHIYCICIVIFIVIF